MDLTLTLDDEAALAAAQEEVKAHGGLLVPLGDATPPALFTPAKLAVCLADKKLTEVNGKVVQLTPDGQAAVLVDDDDRGKLAAAKAKGPQHADSSQPLWAKIAAMSKGEKLKLAKHGNPDARRILLKDPDPALHLQILNNPGVTANEIASLIKGGAASVPFIKQVLQRSDFMGNATVIEALVVSPKTPLSDAIKLMNKVNLEVAKRIAKTGKGRGPVVQAAKRRVTR